MLVQSSKGLRSIVFHCTPPSLQKAASIPVPDQGALGDGSLIGKERAFLADLQSRALELKRRETSVEEAGKLLAAEFKSKYPDWESMGPVPNVVRRVYVEAQ